MKAMQHEARAVLIAIGMCCPVAAIAEARQDSPAKTPAPARAPGAAPADAQRFRDAVERSQLREKALDMLVAAVLSADPLARANALEGLHAAPKRAEDAVRAALTDDNAGVRFVAAMTVGQLKLRQSAPFVETLLNDSDPRVRGAAIFALVKCGKQPDQTSLADMLQSDDPRIRSEAARLVGFIGNPSAAPMLKAAAADADARNRQLYGPNPSEQRFQLERLFQLQVAEALVRLGEGTALDSIRAALYPSSREGFESAAVAAQILGGLKDEKAAPMLVELIEQTVPGSPPAADPRQREYVQPREVRLAAAMALAQMNFPDGVYVAEMYEKDADPAVRAQAAFVFGAVGRASDLARLETLMSDEVEMVRISAGASVLKILERSGR